MYVQWYVCDVFLCTMDIVEPSRIYNLLYIMQSFLSLKYDTGIDFTLSQSFVLV